jgi:hypothetical protein
VNRTLEVAAICLAAALVAPATALAQVTHSIALYGPAVQVNGTAQVGDATADVNVEADELLDKLEMAAVAGYRLATPRWCFIASGLFVGLGQSKHGRSMDVDGTIVELDAGYRLSGAAELLVGVRYTDLSVEVGDTSQISGEWVSVKNGDEFFDPIVGIRFVAPVSSSEKWMVEGRGDVGGFGVGMDLQWQAMLNLGYHPNDSVTIWLGYRALAQDFDDAGSTGQFAMDVTYHGPQLGATFAF